MFAFAGASTFPTIQADMKDKTKFPKAVVVAMVILASIYLTMSATSWGLLGDRYPFNLMITLTTWKISLRLRFSSDQIV